LAAIARRKAIYEELHPETRPTSEGGGGRNNATRRQVGEHQLADRFTADTAAKTGQSERAVQRAAARGAALGDDLADIAGTSLDGREKNSVAGALLRAGPNSPQEHGRGYRRARSGLGRIERRRDTEQPFCRSVKSLPGE
jgi:hypothetical protein